MCQDLAPEQAIGPKDSFGATPKFNAALNSLALKSKKVDDPNGSLENYSKVIEEKLSSVMMRDFSWSSKY
jgi:hypothetical protein